MSNIEFYTKKDINDSLLLTKNSLNISDELLDEYLTEVNNMYEGLCAEKGVYDDDIVINDSTTSKDERNVFMVKMCKDYFYMNAFFGLSSKENDIYWNKAEKFEKWYNAAKQSVTLDKITGETPPVSQNNQYASIELGHA